MDESTLNNCQPGWSRFSDFAISKSNHCFLNLKTVKGFALVGNIYYLILWLILIYIIIISYSNHHQHHSTASDIL